ncbi:MAG: CDP-diacylglycerol--glycerol-3-phosphate 3-phosphatidyltransferase [Pseudomonadota bacterium]|nr:CDP-diacylglycerol--glycerol-3-phosphate 3-phosphatidyltransferase [Pseudomonadota bacterium]
MLAQIPNAITILRILLVIPIGMLLWQNRHTEAFLLMLIAGISDAFDGYLARRFNWMSPLGAALDPLADKFLVACVFVVFTLQGHIPLWVAFIVLVRDFTIVAGAGVYKMLYEEVEIAPTFLSKANTATQIIVLMLILLSLLPFGEIGQMSYAVVDPYCFYLLAVLGLVSGVDYVFTWGSRAYWEEKTRKLYKHGPARMRRPRE